MSESTNFFLILSTAFIVTSSPGASTLAIADASMNGGRRQGLAIATGITMGSWMWSASAAFGLGALMTANAWAFEIMRYAGAAYLIFLAWRSARSAWQNRPVKILAHGWNGRVAPEILRGFLIHLTNPKVILFFAALYATGAPANPSARDLTTIVLLVGGQSMAIFIIYVLAFSSKPIVRVYTGLARPFNAILSVMFIIFAVSLFLAKLPSN